MPKYIENKRIRSCEGYPMKVAALDQDGEVVFVDSARQVPKMVESRAADELRLLVINIPRQIQKPMDSTRISEVFRAIQKAKDGRIELGNVLYDWLKRLMRREVSPTEEEAKQGAGPIRYLEALRGLANASDLWDQLLDPSDHEPFVVVDDDGGEKTPGEAKKEAEG